MNLITKNGVELHAPPLLGNKVTIQPWAGKFPYYPRSCLFYDLRGYRQWLMTG